MPPLQYTCLCIHCLTSLYQGTRLFLCLGTICLAAFPRSEMVLLIGVSLLQSDVINHVMELARDVINLDANAGSPCRRSMCNVSPCYVPQYLTYASYSCCVWEETQVCYTMILSRSVSLVSEYAPMSVVLQNCHIRFYCYVEGYWKVRRERLINIDC